MRMVVLLSMLLLAHLPLQSQDVPPTDSFGVYDSIVVDAVSEKSVDHRPFDETKWKEVVGDIDYSEAVAPKRDFEWFSTPWAGPLLKIISYVVIICIVGWVLHYFLTNLSFNHTIQRTTLSEDLHRNVENIESLDIEALLAQARREGNFRIAIRLYYLGLLKKLHALGMIGWKKDKTNRDYLSELFSKDFYYQDMQRLTVLYEAVWYGEHSLKGQSFQTLTDEFESVYRKLNAAEPK